MGPVMKENVHIINLINGTVVIDNGKAGTAHTIVITNVLRFTETVKVLGWSLI